MRCHVVCPNAMPPRFPSRSRDQVVVWGFSENDFSFMTDCTSQARSLQVSMMLSQGTMRSASLSTSGTLRKPCSCVWVSRQPFRIVHCRSKAKTCRYISNRNSLGKPKRLAWLVDLVSITWIGRATLVGIAILLSMGLAPGDGYALTT